MGETAFSAITGPATSTFTALLGGMPAIGKITGFGYATFSAPYKEGYTVTGDLNVTNLTVGNVFVDAGNVTVTGKAILDDGCVRAVGAGNMKLNNVDTTGNEAAVVAKANAKGVSLLNISGDINCAAGSLGIGIMYAGANMENPLYVTFYDGQSVATMAKAENISNITLLTGGSDAEDGHNLGAEATFDEEGNCLTSGWYLDYVAKSKTVMFKRAAAE